MKLNRVVLHRQRRALDRRLAAWHTLPSKPPRSGWLRAVRESLGLSARQLANEVGLRAGNIQQAEQREVEGAITLATLRRFAQAMDCELVYAVVPRTSLEEILDVRARAAARRMASNVLHSMRLEDQRVSSAETEEQLEELEKQLKEKLDPALWNTDDAP